jgi:hypothetical protein
MHQMRVTSVDKDRHSSRQTVIPELMRLLPPQLTRHHLEFIANQVGQTEASRPGELGLMLEQAIYCPAKSELLAIL